MRHAQNHHRHRGKTEYARFLAAESETERGGPFTAQFVPFNAAQPVHIPRGGSLLRSGRKMFERRLRFRHHIGMLLDFLVPG